MLLSERGKGSVGSCAANWLEIESRMRQTLHRLLKPICERTHADRDRLAKAEKYLYKFHTIRLEQLTEYINKKEDFDSVCCKKDKYMDVKKGQRPLKPITRLGVIDSSIDEMRAEIRFFQKAQQDVDMKFMKKGESLEFNFG